jgi:uncharacterized repeat protein (TIGR03803 family)
MRRPCIGIARCLCILVWNLSPLTGQAQTLTVLREFNNGADGGNPSGLTLGTNGNLFGSAVNGGDNGWGALFQFSAVGGLSQLYPFTGGTDGANPVAGLTQGTNGLFYGMAESAGATGNGTIFEVSSSGAFSPLHSFARLRPKGDLLTNADGAAPVCALTLGTNGNFYGTAPQGGSNGYGTIFEVTHKGEVSVLYSFTGGVDGAAPEAALLQFTNGNLYGTTIGGGSDGDGAVFQLTAAGDVTPLYSFTNGADGSAPQAALIDGHDGNLYGTCTTGGEFGTGTIFKITPAGVLMALYSFTAESSSSPYYNSDGVSPETLVLGNDGNFYGLAYKGGANGSGDIFEFTQTGGLTNLYSFLYLEFTGEVSVNADGGEPASLLQTSDGEFYGIAYSGGTNGFGTLFTIGLAPQITSQPGNQTVALDGGASFSVGATGALAYQWQFDNENIPDATNDTLNFANVQETNAGYYQVIVTNLNGATTSSVVTLGITNLPVSFVVQAGALSYVGGQATLELTNLAGQGVVVIDASTDLIDWTPIVTNPAGFGAMQVIDPNAAAYGQRFYRARTQ